MGSNPTYVAEDALRGEKSHHFHEIFANLGVPLDGEQTFVMPSELAPGVWHLGGGSHHSLVIEQSNGVVVVEAPLYAARSEAVYAWIQTQFPTKPVTHLIATHHHTDHSAGIRTYAGLGATVVMSDDAIPFFARIFESPRTIVPDRLSASPRIVPIIGVATGTTHRIDDAVRPVDAVHINSGHAADMLVIHVPSAQIVFNSDLYSPGFPVMPPFDVAGAQLHGELERLELEGSTMVGGHGFGVSTWQEFETALGL
jgi:glyoxylase-like metal-dependent hydrolase (beta-lactamase superfamily II)